MVITDKMKRSFPVLSDAELRSIRIPKEDLIEDSIKEFNRRADIIDSTLDKEDHYAQREGY